MVDIFKIISNKETNAMRERERKRKRKRKKEREKKD
jgi:hypothetical protein